MQAWTTSHEDNFRQLPKQVPRGEAIGKDVSVREMADRESMDRQSTDMERTAREISSEETRALHI